MASSFYRKISAVSALLTAAESEMDVNLNPLLKIHIHFIFHIFS